jgi:hypothetical protein
MLDADGPTPGDERFPDAAPQAWHRLLRDVIGGGSAATARIAALDRPVDDLLRGVDVAAALGAEDGAASATGDAEPLLLDVTEIGDRDGARR